jgi:hypothetical protein
MSEPVVSPVGTMGAPPPGALASSLSDVRRIALALLADAAAGGRDDALALLGRLPCDAVARALASDQVDQLVLEAATASGLADRLPSRIVELLKARRRAVAVAAFRQSHVLDKASRRFDELGIEHVVFKGALLRPMLYAKPYLRPALDVDLLVAPARVAEAIRALEASGLEASVAAHSDTHEVSLAWHEVALDLHWIPLRPGRMRVDITREILATRVRAGDLWRPDDAHLTVLMLFHPAVTDHVTAKLISAIDVDRWLRSREIPWPAVVAILDRIGLRTAAWAMLSWTRTLLGTPVPEAIWRELAPSLARQRYLEAWLRRHPAELYWKHPWLVRGAFSLALQDRVSDAARALWKLARRDRLSLDGGSPRR